MLDIQYIQNNKTLVKENMKNRKKNPELIDTLLELHEKRAGIQNKVDVLNQKKKLNAQKHTEDYVIEGRQIKEKIKELQNTLEEIEQDYFRIFDLVPNIATPDTPIGKDDTENIIIKKVGKEATFDFTPLTHWEIGKKLDILDNEAGVMMAGARFTYLKGDAALLEFAIMRLVIKTLTDEAALQKIIQENDLKVPATPFIPVIPPIFIKPDIFQKTGRLNPKVDKFYLPEDDLYITGTAEQGLLPLFINKVFKEDSAPIRYVGVNTACRREAGTYGKDMRGILRMHQFNKAEMLTVTTPEMGLEEHKFLTAIQEYLLKALDVPYHVVAICTGDIGEPDAKQVDMETWMPGQGVYKETHTADYNTDFQARRMNIKIKRKDGTAVYAHTNDATAFATNRIIAAIIENYQQKNGTFLIPERLQQYL